MFYSFQSLNAMDSACAVSDALLFFYNAISVIDVLYR